MMKLFDKVIFYKERNLIIVNPKSNLSEEEEEALISGFEKVRESTGIGFLILSADEMEVI